MIILITFEMAKMFWNLRLYTSLPFVCSNTPCQQQLNDLKHELMHDRIVRNHAVVNRKAMEQTEKSLKLCRLGFQYIHH